MLDRLGTRLRSRRVARQLKGLPPPRLIDVGCGAFNSCIEHLLRRGVVSETSLGIDPNVPQLKSPNFEQLDVRGLRQHSFHKFDMATSLAVIEHLPVNEVLSHLRDTRACLRPGGALLLTTPTPSAKPVLEFLAFRLRVLSQQEIADHRHYWSSHELMSAPHEAGYSDIWMKYFQLGPNRQAIAKSMKLSV